MTESEEESSLGELLRKRELYQHKPPIYGRIELEWRKPQGVFLLTNLASLFLPNSHVQIKQRRWLQWDRSSVSPARRREPAVYGSLFGQPPPGADQLPALCHAGGRVLQHTSGTHWEGGTETSSRPHTGVQNCQSNQVRKTNLYLCVCVCIRLEFPGMIRLFSTSSSSVVNTSFLCDLMVLFRVVSSS